MLGGVTGELGEEELDDELLLDVDEDELGVKLFSAVSEG